ncbi:MAG: aromatic ring-hydroxylating dioxygenase subunit alpha [Deltaproteobacteria bacterium]|nr:aromatic ring-hydroxylating dioxygenase subunit alpha [Deltaproteobacteria bacterium]
MKPTLSKTLFADLTPETLRTLPLTQAVTNPSAWFIDPRFHELDREAIFAATWQSVGYAAQLDEPGQYFTCTVADEPVIVLRDRDGLLRAFYNVCRHRGGPLALDHAGCVKALQCKYHGWTYLTDGSLRGIPKWNAVELFDRKDYGLVPIQVALWEGLVFVNLSRSTETLETRLGGIVEQLRPNRIGTKRFARRVDYDVQANWKVYVENYLEGYHVPLVHPALNQLLDVQEYVTELYPSYSLQKSPIRAGKDDVYTQGAGGEAFYYWIWPNLMLNLLGDRLQVNLVVPVAHDRCKVIFWTYYDDPTGPGQAERIAGDLAYSDEVQAEDRLICEHVQRGLGSRAYDQGRFSVEMEQGVHHFQTLLKETYARWLRPG